MVVAPDGKVAPRTVKVGSAQGNDWVILDGLKAGELVVVDGFQKMRPGAPVKPVPWTAGNPPGAATAQAAPKAQGAAAAPAAAGSAASASKKS